jgi:hypothetical protein
MEVVDLVISGLVVVLPVGDGVDVSHTWLNSSMIEVPESVYAANMVPSFVYDL